MKISIIGLGFVGDAMITSFIKKNIEHNVSNKDIIIYGYDKFKNGGIGTIDECLNSDIIFTALPTLYDEKIKNYDNNPTLSVVDELNKLGYKKIIVIKSTVEPMFTEKLSELYPTINFIHNPEFLTARTSFEDFHNQNHIILGKTNLCSNDNFYIVKSFYEIFYPNANISETTSLESECVKIYCNSFYSIKIQFFTELYCLSNNIGCDYNKIRDLMLKNNWINPMHTQVPGHDEKISYGGACFPKDTNALLQFMIKQKSPHEILKSCIKERNDMRI